jgi:hypothetical protein
LWGCGFITSASGMDFSLGGFGTLGVARSSDESAEFVRDLSQPQGLTRDWSIDTDSILGIQANVGFSPELRAAVQAVARYRFDGAYEPEISWAFLGYTPTPVWTVRAGRLGTEFYMLSDSRMVGYSYLTVRPPVDFYGTLPFNSVDGLDVAAAAPFAGGLINGKLYAGLSREQSPWEDLQFNMSGSRLVGGYLDYRKGDWQIRLGHARVRFESDLPIDDFYALLPTATADELRVKDHWTSFSSLGLVYDKGPLQTQLMIGKTDNEQATFQDTWSGYFILAYRVHNWTPFIGLSAAKSTAKALDHPIPGYTDAYQANFHTDQRTLFLGARWDFHANMALKAQVDIIRGDPSSTFLYRWETADWDGSMNVFSLSWDFVF